MSEEQLSYERIESIKDSLIENNDCNPLINVGELRELCRLALVGKKEEYFKVERRKIIDNLFKETMSSNGN